GPRRSALFPSTTLFRSARPAAVDRGPVHRGGHRGRGGGRRAHERRLAGDGDPAGAAGRRGRGERAGGRGPGGGRPRRGRGGAGRDRKSTRLNSSYVKSS